MTTPDTIAPYVLISTPEEVEQGMSFFKDWRENMSAEQEKYFAELDLSEGEDDPSSEGRCFTFAQFITHPETGERMYSQEQLNAGIEALEAGAILDKYAFIYHYSDVTGGYHWDVELPNDDEISPLHVHVVILLKAGVKRRLRTIGDLFTVPYSRIRRATKRGPNGKKSDHPKRNEMAFLDICQYLCHLHKANLDARDAGKSYKYLYDPREVVANFDFIEYLETEPARLYSKKGVGGSGDLQKRLELAVLSGEMTVADVIASHPSIFSDKGMPAHLYKLRHEYLKTCPPPRRVVNIYIPGGGGAGKDLFAEGLARILLGDDGDAFEVNGAGVTFENCDGEAGVIWHDFTAAELLSVFGGRGRLFDLLNPWPKQPKEGETPRPRFVNVKYGKVPLLNWLNIITGPESYEEFLDGLVAGYEELPDAQSQDNFRRQSYRRFPIIIPVDYGSFSVMLNKGFLNDNDDFFEYEIFGAFRQDLRQLKLRCAALEACGRASESEALETTVFGSTLAPVLEGYERIAAARSVPEALDEIYAEFADSGKLIEPEIIETELVEEVPVEPDLEQELKELRGLNAGWEKHSERQGAEIVKLNKALADMRQELKEAREAHANTLRTISPQPEPSENQIVGIVVP